MSSVYHHYALEYHLNFEIHQIFTDLGNGTKHAGYDHGTLYIVTSRHCGKKSELWLKNPDALWVEIKNFCP